MREAFPWDHPCRYLLRDRDAIYGGDWVAMTKGLGMEEVISAPRSPWQNPYVERLIGSIRRECLDHLIVWNVRSLRRTLKIILPTTSAPEPIWRWPRTLRSRESWRSQKAGASSRFLNLEDSITDTNAMPLSVSRSSATIASVLLMNQSNLVAS